MSEMKWAIITGADGGMGTEITRAVAKAGYRIIMACYHPKKAEVVAADDGTRWRTADPALRGPCRSGRGR